MAKIKVVLGKDGTTRMEVLGAAGDRCLELTRRLETRLGVVEERTLKPECELAEHEAQIETEAGA